jgi:hypothetical protein
MAQKRMFSLQVVDTDKFMDMPTSAQALYFHLGMHGDDDGFVSSPRKIARAAGCNNDDMRLLATKGFIIPFDSGVVVITDWKVNNTLKNDRYQETIYQSEKAILRTEKNGKYIIGTNTEPQRFQNGTNTEPQHNITEPNPVEHRLTENNIAALPCALSADNAQVVDGAESTANTPTTTKSEQMVFEDRRREAINKVLNHR